MSTATTETPAAKKPAKRKVASKPKEPKPPKIPTFHVESGSRVEPVVLNPDELLIKYNIKDRMEDELKTLELTRETLMAEYKGKIKAKEEEIGEIARIVRTKVEERNVPVWNYYDLRAGILFTYENTGKPLNRKKDKQIDREPLTPEERRKFAQPALISVPATIPPATNGTGHITEAIVGALGEMGVPVNQPLPKDGDKPADPARTNPTSVEEVKFVGDEEIDETGLEEHQPED